MFFCMRTTLNLDDALMRKAKRLAAETGKTLTQVMEEALEIGLAGTPARKGRFHLRWVPVEGKLRPGVDLDDRDALYELMEERP